MSRVHSNGRSDTSISSADQDRVQDGEEKKVQNFAKQMLQGRLFIGIFQEKRHVINLNAYRDVVMISREEHDLIRDLEAVRKRVQNYYTFNHWVGITTPEVIGAPVGHCIWVELDDEVFGSYWYKIKSIRFRRDEILLRIKALRRVNVSEDSHQHVARKSSTSKREQLINKEDVELFIKTCFAKYFSNFFSTVLTWHNTKEAVVFISLLIATIATGSVHILKYLAEYFLKLMRETSNFVKVATPIVLACVNLLGKTIGGFYLLIATLWRDRNNPPQQRYESLYVNTNRPMISYYGYESLPNPPRSSASSVVITQLD